MAEARLGYPAVVGDTITVPAGKQIFMVAVDSTRRILPFEIHGHQALPMSRTLFQNSVVAENEGGFIPFQAPISGYPGIFGGDMAVASYETLPTWIAFPSGTSDSELSKIPVTPGNDYYRVRRILGDHALRFVSEHNPSQLRYADPSQRRIETVAHELTNEDRLRAACADQYIRGDIGYIWGINEFLRQQNPQRPDAWKATVAKIESLLEPFCALCEGSGMSHRTIRKHPVELWERYQLAGMRFISDRQFNATPFTEDGVVTDLTQTSNLQNFVYALDWASEGYPDDDYLSPRTQLAAHQSVPVMPQFVGNARRTDLIYYAHAWYKIYTTGANSLLDPGILRKMCVANLLVILDDRNFQNEVLVVGINSSIVYGDLSPERQTELNKIYADFDPFAGTYSGALLNAYYFTDSPDAGGAWVDMAERTRRLDIVDDILGDATPRT